MGLSPPTSHAEVLVASVLDYGVVGNGIADDTAGLTAALAAMQAAGGTLLIPAGVTVKYTSAVALPAHLRLVGEGRSSILSGPGLTMRFAVNTVNDADLAIADLLLDGSAYDATGRGLDLLCCSMVELTRVAFSGYRDQIVFDQGQRLRLVQTQHDATVNTRFGLWIPKGPEANVGVVAATGTSNIVHLLGSHFNWNTSTNVAGVPIADDGGLQHLYDSVQCSYGVHSMRLAGCEGVELRGCDLEFCTGASAVLTATTAAGDGSAVGSVAALTVGPGNYVDKQIDLAGTDVLYDLGNQFHIPNLPVYLNCGSATAIFSHASGNVSVGGTLFDASPTGNLFTYDRTGIATFRNTVLGFNFRANGGGNPLASPQLWISSLPTTISFGTNYGYGADQNAALVLNAPSTRGVKTQLAGTDSLVLDDGSGGASFFPKQISVIAFITPAATTGVWTPVSTNTGSWLGGILQGAGAQNDLVAYDVLLGPGTWTMDLFHRADSNCGIYTCSIDGVSMTTLGGSTNTIDGYNAAATATASHITGIVLAGPGKVRRVQLLMATKNASSSNFTGKPCALCFTRTA